MMPPFISVSLWLREKPLLRIEHGLITPSMYNLFPLRPQSDTPRLALPLELGKRPLIGSIIVEYAQPSLVG